jgi:hypothetical protein
VDSEIGRGSKFSFRLPLRALQDLPEPPRLYGT